MHGNDGGVPAVEEQRITNELVFAFLSTDGDEFNQL